MLASFLAGVPILASSPISWELKTGARPHVGHFPVHRNDAERIQKLHRGLKPIDLVLGGITIQNLFVLGLAPEKHPDRLMVSVADVRWLFQSKHIHREYNVKKLSGDRRDVAGEIEDIGLVQDDIDYAIWSLNNGQPWKAHEVVADVLNQLKEQCEVAFSFESPSAKGLSVSGLLLDHQGDAALARAMSLARVDYYVSPGGNFIAVDPEDLTESEVLTTLAPYTSPTAPIPIFQDRANTRPSAYEICFTREQEVRFDYTDGPDPVSSGSSAVRDAAAYGRGEAPRILANVARVTDPELEVAGRVLAHGSYAPLDDLLEAWAEEWLTDKQPADRALSFETVLKTLPTGHFESVYGGGYRGVIAKNPKWGRRTSETTRTIRQVFRIPRFWIERTLRVLPVRAAVLDPETGQRQPSVAFCDYAVRFHADMPIRGPSGDTREIQNRYARASQFRLADMTAQEWRAHPLTLLNPAMARVEMESPHEGIFRLDFGLENQWGYKGQVWPCEVLNLSEVVPRTGYGAKEGEGMRLVDRYRMAVILSLVPATPPGLGGLYKVTVDASKITSEACTGPKKVVKVDDSIATARFAWAHDRATEIEKSFGMLGGDSAQLSDLLINKSELEQLADAVAKADMLPQLNRWEGTMVAAGLHGVRPKGNISKVEWSVSTDGVATTGIVCPPYVITANFRDLLPEGVRRKLGLSITPGR